MFPLAIGSGVADELGQPRWRMPPQRRTLQGTPSPPPRILADSASSPCTSLASASSSGPFLVGILDEARGRTLLPPQAHCRALVQNADASEFTINRSKGAEM